jgi:hypothetical protein
MLEQTRIQVHVTSHQTPQLQERLEIRHVEPNPPLQGRSGSCWTADDPKTSSAEGSKLSQSRRLFHLFWTPQKRKGPCNR